MSEHLQVGPHPDPDTLNAFAEGVLPEHERLACLTHFAECGACREVVYLAEGPVPVVAARPRVRWWIPVFSAAAVAGIAVLSVVVIRLEKPAPAIKPPATVAMSPPVAVLAAPRPRAKALRMAPAPAPAAANDAISIKGSVPTSAIAGTVTDSTGAVIAGAAVTVRPTSGAPVVKATTDTSGQFQIAGLPPGQYDLNVSQLGFAAASKKVELEKDQVARADSSLQVGSTAQSVEVTASSPMIATSSAMLAPVPRAVKRPVVTIVTRGKVILKVDSEGGLLRSGDSGKKWKVVKAVWKAKAVQLADENGEFQLKTETGAIWLSKDGNKWHADPVPQH